MGNPTSGKTYCIVNKKSGTAFDLSGADQRSIIGFGVHRRDNQKWRLHEDSDGGWTIQNVYNGKYLDVDVPNVTNDGERVVAVETNSPRRWDLRKDDQFGGWRIFIHGSDKINVDLSDHGNPAPGTPVTLWGKWAGQNQVWDFEEA